MATAPRAHDCLVNVHFGDSGQPEYMVRVKNEYFRKDDRLAREGGSRGGGAG